MLQQKINEDIKEFLKAGRSFETGVLRLMAAMIKNKEIENKGNGKEGALSDEEIIDLLMKEAKKRKEAAEIYKKGGREDLAEKENKELEMIKNYLPKELSAEEILKIIDKVIAVVGATDIKEMRKVVAEAAKELRGKADMGEVSKMIKDKLES